MMDRANLTQYLEFFLSNEDVKNSKPDPEMYTKAIKLLGLNPTEVVIVEDNDHGLQAARLSGAHVLQVHKVEETNYNNIKTFISNLEREIC
jgi:beta-phosphoglucomutase